jgi:hypothetical protein
VISAQVFGAQSVAARLEKAGHDLDRAEKAIAVRGSLLVRRGLVAHMTGRATRDPFWGKGSPSGAFLGGRTGQTRDRLSPGGVAVKTFGRWTAAVGSPDAHVLMHEVGGTIHGRQFLRIPTAAAQTLGGQDRNVGRSIRDIPGSFLFRSNAGKLWAAVRGAGDSQITLLYLLVRRVTHRARGLFAAVEREVRPKIVALGAAEVRTVVRDANG